MRHPTDENRGEQAIFERMEELAADGTKCYITVWRATYGEPMFSACIGDEVYDSSARSMGRTLQEAWRAACDVWERRNQSKPSRIYPAEAGTTKHYLTDKGLPYSVTFFEDSAKP